MLRSLGPVAPRESTRCLVTVTGMETAARRASCKALASWRYRGIVGVVVGDRANCQSYPQE
jgi:hypothetical protein